MVFNVEIIFLFLLECLLNKFTSQLCFPKMANVAPMPMYHMDNYQTF